MSEFIAKKWHINRLSGNHKQGDYKKTTEYLDSHALNTIDLIISDNVYYKYGVMTCDAIYFTYNDFFKMKPWLSKVILYKYSNFTDVINTQTYAIHYFALQEGYNYTLNYCDYNVDTPVKWMIRNDEIIYQLIAIGTGDLELVVDEVEEMGVV